MGGSLVFGLYGGDGQVYQGTLEAPRSRHINSRTLPATREDETPKTNGAAKLGVRQRRRRIPNA